ncbi:hypothetical protein [Pseudoduganella sp.]|uniref:hypothetical protein n=1 Tax=Pseudoduganella sp. TaxID=1880898 RepID=UPI0035B07167
MKTWVVFAPGCTASAFGLAAPVDNPLRFSGKMDAEARAWSFPVAARINGLAR